MINNERINDIKFLIFDGDDTVISFYQNHKIALEYARSMIPDNRKKFIVFVWLFEILTLGIKSLGLLSATELKLKTFLVIEALMLFTSPKRFMGNYFKKYNELEYEIVDVDDGNVLTATEVLNRLSKKYTIIIASNNSQNSLFFEERGITKDYIYIPKTRKSKIIVKKFLGIGARKPELLDFILRDHSIWASQCLMIGDSLHDDIKTAKSRGIGTLLLNREISREVAKWIDPDYFCQDFHELLKVLL